MRLWVFGDSFSASTDPAGWANVLGANLGDSYTHDAMRGISEYRIFRKFQSHAAKFEPGDLVVICHTNPVRVYLPDHVRYPSRRKATHPECDLVLGDAMSQSLVWRFITRLYYSYFYDEEYLTTQFNLMADSMHRTATEAGCKVLHVTGFPSPRPDIVSFHDVFQAHRGEINHMSAEGNRIVAARIRAYFFDT